MLKEREIREHGLDDNGRWRTRALVLDALDRFERDGTFDRARQRDARRAEAPPPPLRVKVGT